MPYKKNQSPWNKGKRKAPIERFMSFVIKQDNGCWLWQGGKSGRGYGYFFVEVGNQPRAHRFSYEFHKGKIPDGLFVCHSCDVPLCVNPEHLWAGTPKQNTRDALEKGIMKSKGEGNPNSKLSKSDVDRIRTLYQTNKYSQTEIARMFNVCQVHVSAVVRHKLWK